MKSKLKILLLSLLFNPVSLVLAQNNLPEFIRFPHQDSSNANYSQAQPLMVGNEILLFTIGNKFPQDSIYLSRSSDSGQNWSNKTFVADLIREKEDIVYITSVISSTGRIVIVYTIGNNIINHKSKVIYSDDTGITWSIPTNVIGSAYIPFPKLVKTMDEKLWLTARNNNFFFSTDNGITWAAKNIGFSAGFNVSFDFIALDSMNYLMAYDKIISGYYLICMRKSSDSGESWSEENIITNLENSEKRPRLYKESDGTILLITQKKDSTQFSLQHNIFEENIVIRKSLDNGISWDNSFNYTVYPGFDGNFNICEYPDKPLIAFSSDRWYGINQVWIGQLEISQEDYIPPVLYMTDNSGANAGIPLLIRAFVGSTVGIQKVELLYSHNGNLIGPLSMFDDGNHGDGGAGDNIWGIYIGPFTFYDILQTQIVVTDINSVSVTFAGEPINFSPPVPENKWMSVGKLHNWYSSLGSELEQGFVATQQYGMRWPAIYRYQDLQAARGIWLGCTNFTDENGSFYPHKVVAVGPRNPQIIAVYPTEFKLVSKYNLPLVKVNGQLTYNLNIVFDIVDNSMKWDRMILNKFNSQLGVSVERKIYQFGQSFNDSYIVYDLTFKNTGNVDLDPDIELPNTTIENFYVMWHYRNAINVSTGYVIGNPTRWGINTMNDARGDGVIPDPPGENFRAQFSWHGYYPDKVIPYDNIGAPIWSLNQSALLYNDPADTIGRLGGTQFSGIVTLHADHSSINTSDDPAQPATTSWADSDSPIFYPGSNPYNQSRMTQEYNFMASGHQSPRHAYAVQPDGNFAMQRSNANIYQPTTGGTSFSTGFGPYTLAPGEDIHIVIAEAVGGLSRERQVSVGQLYKAGSISDGAKDSIVILEGRDSLFSTFRNAIDNFNSGWNIPLPPQPPTTFNVNSDSQGVSLSWSINDADPPDLFRIYRAEGQYYNDYSLIAELASNIRTFLDTNCNPYTDYYYFISSVGHEHPGGPATPPGRLESSRYYTQTYDPVRTNISTGIQDEDNLNLSFSLEQNYPNPFNPSTKIKYSIPESGRVVLCVFNILGEEIVRLVDDEKLAGKYEVDFNAYNLPSGVYFYTIRSFQYSQTKKMILLR